MDSLTSIWPPATTKNAGGFAGVCRSLQDLQDFQEVSGGLQDFRRCGMPGEEELNLRDLVYTPGD